MRQGDKRDVPFFELLERAADGKCTAADHETLSTHVITTNADSAARARTPRFRNARIIVSRNLLRMAINNEFTCNFARATKARVFVSVAVDLLARQVEPGPIMRMNLLDLPDGQTNHHLGKLLLA